MGLNVYWQDNRPLWRRERDRRGHDREFAHSVGRVYPRLRTIGLVETAAIDVPDWALAKAIKGLHAPDGAVWLGRIDANYLAKLDRESGGRPKITLTAFRRCGICQRALIGDEAEERFELDQKSEGRRLPCGPDCIERESAIKSQKRKNRNGPARIEQ